MLCPSSYLDLLLSALLDSVLTLCLKLIQTCECQICHIEVRLFEVFRIIIDQVVADVLSPQSGSDEWSLGSVKVVQCEH